MGYKYSYVNDSVPGFFAMFFSIVFTHDAQDMPNTLNFACAHLTSFTPHSSWFSSIPVNIIYMQKTWFIHIRPSFRKLVQGVKLENTRDFFGWGVANVIIYNIEKYILITIPGGAKLWLGGSKQRHPVYTVCSPEHYAINMHIRTYTASYSFIACYNVSVPC